MNKQRYIITSLEDIPGANGAVLTSGDDSLVIDPQDLSDASLMSSLDGDATGWVLERPDDDRLIQSSRGDELRVGTEAQAVNSGSVEHPILLLQLLYRYLLVYPNQVNNK